MRGDGRHLALDDDEMSQGVDSCPPLPVVVGVEVVDELQDAVERGLVRSSVTLLLGFQHQGLRWQGYVFVLTAAIAGVRWIVIGVIEYASLLLEKT